MAHSYSRQAIPESIRIAREFEFINQSIQFTAEEQRKLHEEALAEAYRKHEEVRRVAEYEGQRAKEDLAQQQRIRDQENDLRVVLARKDAADKIWHLEEERRQGLEIALAREEAALRQRQANALAEEKVIASRSATPQPLQVQAAAPAPAQSVVQQVSNISAPTPKHQPDTAPEQQSTPVKFLDITKSDTYIPNGNTVSSSISAGAPQQQSSSSTYLGLPLPQSLPSELQNQYLEYIEILMQLKNHRNIFKDQILPDPRYRDIKNQVGDDRRFIRKSVSQLTEDRKKNKEVMDGVMRKLTKALQSPFPKVSLSQFIPGIQGNAPEVSSLYIYLVNVFTKAIFSQFLVDATSDTKKADAIGMFASQILATAQLEWQSQISLWPLLVAKFARRCPVLFGVYGDDKTTQGKILLGWGKEDGKFVTDQRHAERMTALAAGWASITLRDYNKSKMENPAPGWYFWRSMALILNVPAQNITSSHYLVLKALIEHNEQRIMKLFGDYGRMLLQQAVLAYPSNQYTGQSVPAQGLRLLKNIWEKDLHFVFVH